MLGCTNRLKEAQMAPIEGPTIGHTVGRPFDELAAAYAERSGCSVCSTFFGLDLSVDDQARR